MTLLISGGVQPGGDPRRLREPRLLALDPLSGAVNTVLALGSGPRCAGGDHQELTAGFVRDGALWVGTRSEVLCVGLADGSVRTRWGHPLLYDVHSVAPGAQGELLISATGHDSVLRMSEGGELLEHHWLRRGRFWDAYPGINKDFSGIPFDRFKPHAHHPNRAFLHQGSPWVTLFEQRRCEALGGDRVIELPEGPPHDGLLREGLLWFTTVTGVVVAVDPVSLERRLTLDLAALDRTPGLQGWCRGIEVVGSRLFVGMTALRSTTHREVLRRVLRGAAGRKRPSRVVEIDLDQRRVVREWPVFGAAGGGTIFGLYWV
ncbi:MAG: hypothetical protein JXX28_02135 [Deltaproteobacteria bacterium]|nr:hypothetical protein [Deltaproteobacteria bacterium]